MRLIMGVSADGFMARGPNDDMSWLGPTDKAVFRILTGVDGVLAVGRASYGYMPWSLGGRDLHVLSPGRGCTLGHFYDLYPQGWLLGGPRLASIALEQGMVHEVHLCRSDRQASPDNETRAIRDLVTPWLEEHDGWRLNLSTRLNDVTVECWRHSYG